MSPEQLQRAAGCSASIAQAIAEPLSAACAFYGIDTPQRIAAFLAQVGHESGSFKYVRELWGPTAAQTRYEGRADLGNTMIGDGKRFMGRGYIQTTGRYNYAKTRDRLRERFGDVPDFEAEPEALEQPKWACLSACDYWDSRKLNALADADDFETITRRINGGLNGQSDRLARWEKAKAVFNVQIETLPAIEGKDKDMPLPAFAAAALPLIVEAIPKLGKLFGSGSEVAERNVKAAETVIGIVQEAVGAKNAQEAVEIIKVDPAAAQAANKAVEERWFELAEAGGGGIDGARKHNLALMEHSVPVWKNPALWVTLMLLPLIYLTVSAVLFGTGWTSEIRAMVVASVVSGVLGAITGYWLGTSFSSSKKDERAVAAK